MKEPIIFNGYEAERSHAQGDQEKDLC